MQYVTYGIILANLPDHTIHNERGRFDLTSKHREMKTMNSSTVGKLELLSRIAEMKRIYTVIESSINDSACIVVASGIQGEGKSTLSAGLALAASKVGGRKVLAVDFNWYAPQLHSIFEVEPGDNIAFYTDGGPIERLIRHTIVKNLDILPAPKTSRSDAGTGNHPVSDLLKKAKQCYDVIVVDTAPAYPTNQKMIDPIEICKSSDGVVIVTLTNVTLRQDLKRVCTAIETVGANILGVVANQWQNPLF